MTEERSKLNLYNKYRPRKFCEVIGQDLIKDILLKTLNKKKRIQSFIFYGSNGTGKTSLARIFSKAWNCSEFPNIGDVCNQCSFCQSIDSLETMDIYEIDAASHSGVEHMRELIQNSKYISIDLKKKVYIIDEAHNLSLAAWNALLKAIEEPYSENIIFIFLTTNLYKIPETILSRCQKHNFSKFESKDLDILINRVAEGENREVSSEASKLISDLSQGSARECLSLMEQVFLTTSGRVELSDVKNVFSLSNRADILKLIDFIRKKDLEGSINLVRTLFTKNQNFLDYFSEILSFFIDLHVYQKTKNHTLLFKLTEEEAKELLDENIDYLVCINSLNFSVSKFNFSKNPIRWEEIALFDLFNSFWNNSPEDPQPIKKSMKKEKPHNKEEAPKNMEEKEEEMLKISKEEENKILYALSRRFLDKNLSIMNFKIFKNLLKDGRFSPELEFFFSKQKDFIPNSRGKSQSTPMLLSTAKTVVMCFEKNADAKAFNELFLKKEIRSQLTTLFIEDYEWIGLTPNQLNHYLKLSNSKDYEEIKLAFQKTDDRKEFVRLLNIIEEGVK